jgi:hypothetical protein
MIRRCVRFGKYGTFWSIHPVGLGLAGQGAGIKASRNISGKSASQGMPE